MGCVLYLMKDQMSNGSIIDTLKPYLYLMLIICTVAFVGYSSTDSMSSSMTLFDQLIHRRRYLQYYTPQYKSMKMKPLPPSWTSNLLKDFYILGSYRSYSLGGPSEELYDLDALRYAIESGARVLHLDIYNTSRDPSDVILGIGDGATSLPFHPCMELIYRISWQRVDYPMILLLNIHSSHYNQAILDAINRHTANARLYSGTDTVNTITYQSARNKLLILVNEVNQPTVREQDGTMRQPVPNGCVGIIKLGLTNDRRIGETVGQMSMQSILYSRAIDDALHVPKPVNPADIYVSNKISYVGYSCNKSGGECAEPLRRFSMILPEELDGMKDGAIGSDMVQVDVKTAMMYRVNCMMMNFQKYDTQMALALDTFQDRSFVLKKSAEIVGKK